MEWEQDISMFDWFFTPNNTSSKVIAITIGTIKYCYNIFTEWKGLMKWATNVMRCELKQPVNEVTFYTLTMKDECSMNPQGESARERNDLVKWLQCNEFNESIHFIQFNWNWWNWMINERSGMITICLPSIDACIHSRNVRWSEWSGNQWRGATAASETSSNGRRSEWLHSFSFQSIHGVELNEIEWWIEEMNEVWRNQFTFFIHPQEWSSEWLKSRHVKGVKRNEITFN